MIVSSFITDRAKTVDKQLFDATLARASRKTTSSVPWHNVYACGSGVGGDPIEIALDCRVQITRRHLQIAAFKPHGNADTRSFQPEKLS